MHLTDVTLRDGLQSEKTTLTTEQKLQLLRVIVSYRPNRIELTSFVHPKWVPQLADSESFCKQVFSDSALAKTVEWMAFVPNTKGLERLLSFPIEWASAFVAVSETFNHKNVNCAREDTLRDLAGLVQQAQSAGRKCRVYISTVFGCPYQGVVTVREFVEIAKKVADLKPDEIALGDTIGVATPDQVENVLAALGGFWPLNKTALHLHNTYGMALAGIEEGHRRGVRHFDASLGGTGGCPYAKGASGNVSMEEVLYLGWRQEWLEAFPSKELEQGLRVLEATGLETRSQLAMITKKGGSWFLSQRG